MLLDKIPKPLLEDIVENRCIPIIGAGFSKNAVLPPGNSMPTWEELGKAFANEMGEPFSDPIDAISAYEHEFKRPKLIEKLNEYLFVSSSSPGETHKAFCSLPFDKVVTTNYDTLLEQGYKEVNRHCHVIIDEDTLSITPPKKAITLIKLHGDLNHPKRLIATEKDYDSFLTNYQLISTHLSNLLIIRTPLFIGYSLSDPDFRQVWQLIEDRIGGLRRQAYCISLKTDRQSIRRYERRGVRVVNI